MPLSPDEFSLRLRSQSDTDLTQLLPPQPTLLDLPALKPLAFSGLTRFWHPRCIHVQRCAMLGDAVQRFQTFAKHLAPGVRLKGEGSSGWRAQPEKPEARQEG